jgi:hypothetical protein
VGDFALAADERFDKTELLWRQFAQVSQFKVTFQGSVAVTAVQSRHNQVILAYRTLTNHSVHRFAPYLFDDLDKFYLNYSPLSRGDIDIYYWIIININIRIDFLE